MVRQGWGPSRNYRRSVACITATHGGRFELFSEGSGAFCGLKSTTFREVSGTEETDPPPQVRSAIKPAARAS